MSMTKNGYGLLMLSNEPWLQKERIVVLVVVYYAFVPRAVPPHPRVVGHRQLLDGVGVDGGGLVHHDAARHLVGHFVLIGKLGEILLLR